ncbi:MAG: hypothetical protein ABI378_11660 [Chitinophagaceae bacterium]
MKKFLLLACMMCISIFAQAQIIINNYSTCPFAMTALYISGTGGVSYTIAPPGVTTLGGTFAGVWLHTNPNSVGQNDGGDYIDPNVSSNPTNPYFMDPSSGTFLVVGCGIVTVNVTPGPVVNIY